MDWFFISNYSFGNTYNQQAGKLEEGVKYGRLELAKFVGLTGFQDIVEVLSSPSTLVPLSRKIRFK